MKPRLLVIIMVLVLTGGVICIKAQNQPHPDFSGKWMRIEGEPDVGSPLGNEGSIVQDGAAITFQSLRFPSLKVPFDGSTTNREDNAFAWRYEGRWIGDAFIVSMKATSGGTPADFTDLMVMSHASGDMITVVTMHAIMGARA